MPTRSGTLIRDRTGMFFDPLLSPLLQSIMSTAGSASKKAPKSHSTRSHGTTSKGLKEIHIDEEVKISINLSLERFQYSDQKGIAVFCCFISEKNSSALGGQHM